MLHNVSASLMYSDQWQAAIGSGLAWSFDCATSCTAWSAAFLTMTDVSRSLTQHKSGLKGVGCQTAVKFEVNQATWLSKIHVVLYFRMLLTKP